MNAAVLQARHLNHEIINRADQIITHLTAFAARSPFVSQNGEKRGLGAEMRSPQHAVRDVTGICWAANVLLVGRCKTSWLRRVPRAWAVQRGTRCRQPPSPAGRDLAGARGGSVQWRGGGQDGTAQPTLGCSAGGYVRITVKAYFLAITRTWEP